MIARTWRGRAANDKAAAYEKHFTTTVAQNLGGIEGSKGAYLLRRTAEGEMLSKRLVVVQIVDTAQNAKGVIRRGV